MIRELKPSDFNEIARIYKLATSAATVPIGPHWSETQLQEECIHGGYVAESEVGLSAFVLFRELPDAREVSFLASDPSSARRGVMSSLLRHFLNSLPPEKALWLEVHEANRPARSLYEKVGLKESGRRPRYYSDGGAAILYNSA